MIRKILKFNESFSSKNEKEEYDELMSKLLHLYSSIPLPKEKASTVIKKIITESNGRVYRLGEDVNINYQKTHDKVRFKDYFDSLLNSKDSRGHNYEGTLAGLYGGEFSKRGEKWDLTIDNKKWSVKFIDSKYKSVEIGNCLNYFINTPLYDTIIDNGGLTRIIKSDDFELKSSVIDVITNDIDGGWIISYPEIDEKTGDDVIKLHIITVEEMKELFMNGFSVSPKGGLSKIFNLALSSKFRFFNHMTSNIIIPKLGLEDLKSLTINRYEKSWSNLVFDEYGSKIRPDVLRYIKNNSEEIANKLIKFKDFKDENNKI